MEALHPGVKNLAAAVAGKRVLLVEDNQLSRELAASFLEEMGFICSAAGNGKEALGMMEIVSFDLILMDLEMPVMDGLETVRHIRAKGLQMPVIALTAYNTVEENRRCLEAGMNACISKPFQKNELYSLICRSLNLEEKALEEQVSALRSSLPPEGGTIDLAYLERISNGRKGFFMSMIDLFLEQNVADVEALRKAVETEDFKTVRLLAHKIKISIGFVGLEKHIRQHLVEMEQLGENKTRPERIRKLFELVDTVCARANEELRNLKAKKK